MGPTIRGRLFCEPDAAERIPLSLKNYFGATELDKGIFPRRSCLKRHMVIFITIGDYRHSAFETVPSRPP
jgi:hypothetical protein